MCSTHCPEMTRLGSSNSVICWFYRRGFSHGLHIIGRRSFRGQCRGPGSEATSTRTVGSVDVLAPTSTLGPKGVFVEKAGHDLRAVGVHSATFPRSRLRIEEMSREDLRLAEVEFSSDLLYREVDFEVEAGDGPLVPSVPSTSLPRQVTLKGHGPGPGSPPRTKANPAGHPSPDRRLASEPSRPLPILVRTPPKTPWRSPLLRASSMAPATGLAANAENSPRRDQTARPRPHVGPRLSAAVEHVDVHQQFGRSPGGGTPAGPCDPHVVFHQAIQFWTVRIRA